MANIAIPKGSIEFISIQVKDRLGNLTTLNGVTVQFRVVDDEGNESLTWTNATTDGMDALCLVDTTTLPADEYDLFLRITLPPELPILGPFRITVG